MSLDQLIQLFNAQVRSAWLLASLVAYTNGVVQLNDSCIDLAELCQLASA